MAVRGKIVGNEEGAPILLGMGSDGLARPVALDAGGAVQITGGRRLLINTSLITSQASFGANVTLPLLAPQTPLPAGTMLASVTCKLILPVAQLTTPQTLDAYWFKDNPTTSGTGAGPIVEGGTFLLSAADASKFNIVQQPVITGNPTLGVYSWTANASNLPVAPDGKVYLVLASNAASLVFAAASETIAVEFVFVY